MIKSTSIVEILQRKENYGIEHVGSANNRGRNHAIVDIEKDEHRCNEISEESIKYILPGTIRPYTFEYHNYKIYLELKNNSIS